MKPNRSMIAILVLVAVQWNCSAVKNSGSKLGGLAGSIAGSAVGWRVDPFWGGLIGSEIGGAIGEYIGSYMDQQATELDKNIKGARVERIGEGIKLTFDAGVLFDVNKAELKAEAADELVKFATILQKYADTAVLVEGFTDSSGEDAWNLDLSRLRAQTVADNLVSHGVASTRFKVTGNGEADPVASNGTADGRAKNRRVEVSIYASNELKERAKRETDGEKNG